MNQSFIHGAFEGLTSPAISELSLQVQAIDFVIQWRRCGMTADYLADFLAYAYEHREVAKNVVSTVVNELIENAVKFSPDKSRPIWVSVRNLGSALQLETVNFADESQVASFQKTLATLAQGKAEDLFLAQIDRSPSGDQTGSGVGLIVLCRDYSATLAVRAVPDEEPARYRVTVQVTLSEEEIEQR